MARGRDVALAEAIPDLLDAGVVLIGERHSVLSHHIAQLKVIQALHEAGADMAIGLEMIRNENQSKLDRWIAGTLSEKELETVFRENWNMPLELYRSIFDYAENERIPMVGLNISAEITAQVSRYGFQSLTADQRRRLPEITCDVDQRYRKFIQRAYGVHAHGKMNFDAFCEAQLVWDHIMAVHILEYLRHHPNAVVVVLAGTAHVWKNGIPRQIRRRSDIKSVVLMPEPHHAGKSHPLTLDECDYLVKEVFSHPGSDK